MYFCVLPVFSSLTWTIEPTWTTSVETSLASTTVRRAQPLLELGDPLLEHRLLVLGVVVLGVLGDVAELARLLDALGDLAALVGRRSLELVLELLEAFGGEDDVLGHEVPESAGGPPRTRKPARRRGMRGRRSADERGQYSAAAHAARRQAPSQAAPATRPAPRRIASAVRCSGLLQRLGGVRAASTYQG